MRKRLTAIALGAALVTLSLAPVARAQDAQWIHVRVNEQDGAKVSVNLPVSLLEIALEIAEKEAFKGTPGLHLGDHADIDVADLRRIWNQLRESGDAEYVNVQDNEETVRIFREGDRVLIHVNDGDDETVRVEVPFSVVDTLLQGEGDELNFAGALRELAATNNGEIVQVRDGDTDVRVWIDSNNQD